MPAQNQSLLDALNACIAACENCATACLQEQDVKMMARCISLDRDCADICALTRLGARSAPAARVRGNLQSLRRRVRETRCPHAALPGVRRGVPPLRAGLPPGPERGCLSTGPFEKLA